MLEEGQRRSDVRGEWEGNTHGWQLILTHGPAGASPSASRDGLRRSSFMLSRAGLRSTASREVQMQNPPGGRETKPWLPHQYKAVHSYRWTKGEVTFSLQETYISYRAEIAATGGTEARRLRRVTPWWWLGWAKGAKNSPPQT